VHGQGYSEEEDPEHFHNRFPEEWAKLNAEVVADRSSSGSNGTGTDEGEIVFFCRAISTRSPRHATLFWTGDQMVTWDRHDGLHSALLGVLSGGLSGVALTHSDIGGYTMVERCVLGGAICMYITRDCELLMRWAEMSAFTDAMFRTHLGSGPGPYQAQIFSSNASKAHFSAFARVHQSLCEYRTSLVKEAHSSGLPLARHPMLEFPEDAKTIALETQVMMGPEIMLAPVLSPGITSVAVYLPSPSREGEWWVRWPTLDKVVLEGKEGGGGVITGARVWESQRCFSCQDSRSGILMRTRALSPRRLGLQIGSSTENFNARDMLIAGSTSSSCCKYWGSLSQWPCCCTALSRE